MVAPEETEPVAAGEVEEVEGERSGEANAEAVSAEAQPAVPEKRAFVKKYAKPDDSQLKRECEALNAQIEQHKVKVAEIRDLLGSKSESRRSGSGAQQQVRNKLMELRNQFQAELAKKQQFRAELDGAGKARDALRAQARDMKTKLTFPTVEKIDEQIRLLEARRSHTTMSLQEEKKVLEDMKKLKSSRELVSTYNAHLERLSADESLRGQIVEKLKACDDRLNAIKQQEDATRAELSAIREQEQAKTGDIPSLIKEREESRQIIDMAYAKIKELRATFKADLDAWYQNERALREQRNEERKRRQEEYDAERKARDAERKARDAEMRGEPFDKEITICEQLTAYLTKFTESAPAAVEADAAETVEVPSVMQSGKQDFKIYIKPVVAEVDDRWAKGVGGGSKKGKGAKKAAIKANAASKPKPVDTKLTHPLETISAFATLKLAMPLTVSEIPDTLAAITSAKELFLVKRARVKENDGVDPDAEEQEPEPVANGAKANGAVKEMTFQLLNAEDFPEVCGSSAAAKGAAVVSLEEEEEEEPEPEPEEEELPESPEAPASPEGPESLDASPESPEEAPASPEVSEAPEADEPDSPEDAPAPAAAAGRLPDVVPSGVQVSLTVANASNDIAVKLTVDNETASAIEVA